MRVGNIFLAVSLTYFCCYVSAEPKYTAVADALNKNSLKPGVAVDPVSGGLIAIQQDSAGQRIVNQTLLQVTSSGLDIAEFYGNKSLTMYLPEKDLKLGVRVHAHVRVKTANGVSDKTFTFQMKAGKTAVELQQITDGTISLELANATVNQELIRSLNGASNPWNPVKNWNRESSGESTLLECDRLTLNKAFQESIAAFSALHSAKPIVYVDFASSDVSSEPTGIDARQWVTRSGQWVLVLSDETGEKRMVTELSFEVEAPRSDLKQAQTECGGLEKFEFQVLEHK